MHNCESLNTIFTCLSLSRETIKKFKWQNLERSIPEASPGSLKSVELVNQIRRYLRFRTNEMLEKKKIYLLSLVGPDGKIFGSNHMTNGQNIFSFGQTKLSH